MNKFYIKNATSQYINFCLSIYKTKRKQRSKTVKNWIKKY